MLVIGEEEEKFMKKIVKRKVIYTNEPISEIEIIENFLPKPEDLVLKEKTQKITISLTASSLDFFKNFAEKHHTQYQKMIRRLLDQYAVNCMIAESMMSGKRKSQRTQ